MITLKGIAAEALPVDKFGKYLRDHISERGQHYGRDLILKFLQWAGIDISESEVNVWLESRWKEEEEFWQNNTLANINKQLLDSAQYYVRAHKGQNEEE
jgi:hypothetical protein